MTYLSQATKDKKTPDEIRPAPNIAAIDFGTSSVSLAYSINGKDVQTLQLHSDYERVPNAILIRKEGGKFTVQEFGQNAQEKYKNMQQADKDKFIYFERIKILLKRSENIDRKTTVESLTDGKYYLVEVIAFIITYLKELLLKRLPCSDGISEYKSTDFDWVITVPAIWKASAKRMMREAAYMAGLTSEDQSITTFTPVGKEIPRPPEINPDKLFLALEPEAAAIFAQDESKKSSEVRVPPQRYMVVDIGGGTVDITVHNQGDGKVDVIIPPTGNMWGGITVNQACERLLGTIFEDEGFQRFSEQYPNDTAINDLVFLAFEKQKKIFGNKSDINSTDSFSIQLPYKVINFYTEYSIRSGAQSIEANYEDGKIHIKYDVVREMVFQPTVDHILLCVNEALKKELSTKVDTVYVVGGFGGCEFMYNEIQKALQSFLGNCFDNIIRPHLPELAVVKGAVMWRQNPSIIQSRKVDATYGTSCSQRFDPLKHERHPQYCYRDEDGVFRCNGVFDLYIEKGDAAEINDVYITTYTPGHHAQKEMNIPIYSSSDTGQKYVRDTSGQMIYTKIGELIIDIPNPDNKPKSEREVEVSMSFSGTEIRAKAKYCITGEEVKTICDFLTYQD